MFFKNISIFKKCLCFLKYVYILSQDIYFIIDLKKIRKSIN